MRIGGGAAVWMLGLLLAASAQAAPVVQTLPLWPAGQWPPVVQGPEQSRAHAGKPGVVTGVSAPRLEIYRPQHPNGMAVLVFGGGGYARIEVGAEAQPAAQWLQSQGITAAVVYYRLPEDGWAPAAPFQDGQRAMRLLRARAGELGIDPARIGVMGFSAGGNLAGIVGTRFNGHFYAPVDATDRISARPDFMALLYPVVSLQPALGHTHAQKELSRQPDAVEAYSVELHVHRDSPPMFLAQAEDDPIASVDNSKVLDAAARAAGVPVELHLFPHGGHGWGLGKAGSPEAQWPAMFMRWARQRGLLEARP
ncbi:alpha/beta hydrolase [Stenotrophomonas sp. 24(2023)]|uniref:alpha/beta hydrolase n=1 Tax=Stenotrophomonas sp. 24(2023) TaxID=3068324 RepID=UPI0027DF7320|nr:alpha/beta hydrolase [Stenotrophomonas sp. 24(2023)]WMJ70937.1 alpha/beta hydrolase [Stenotrophomonas sp. 24(2023)]